MNILPVTQQCQGTKGTKTLGNAIKFKTKNTEQ